MTRRSVLSSAAAAPFLAAADPAARQSLIEISLFKLHNGSENQRPRAVEFLKAFLPLYRKAGGAPAGAFSASLGEGTPWLMLLRSYAGYAEMEAVNAKLVEGGEFHKAVDAWYAGGPPYMRYESSLLRAFPSVPAVEVPSTEGRKAPRVFELRTYESENLNTLARKVEMFGSGEIGIFRRLGLAPVFFGITVYGRNMPNLTYMVAHDDMIAREKSWAAFRADPEWEKMQKDPKYTDPGLVTNITISLLSPLPFSDIR